MGRLSAALGWLGRHEEAHAYLAETVVRTRATLARSDRLPLLLASAAWQGLHAGRLNEAYADASEALALAEELDQPVTAAQALGVLTWVQRATGRRVALPGIRGRDAAACGRARLQALRAARRLCASGLLDLGRGRVDQAIGRDRSRWRGTRTSAALFVPGVSPQLELAEANMRAGRAADAGGASRRTSTSPSWRRCRSSARRPSAAAACSLRPTGSSAHFAAALELHAEAQSPLALARTRLCYGERLRRAGPARRRAASSCGAALETFEPRSAPRPGPREPAPELQVRAARRCAAARAHEAEELTPQELQIALQVAEGKTNKEVGAALFLSHKTIEFHLSRIYRKLDIHSRAELIRLYASEPTLTGGITAG